MGFMAGFAQALTDQYNIQQQTKKEEDQITLKSRLDFLQKQREDWDKRQQKTNEINQTASKIAGIIGDPSFEDTAADLLQAGVDADSILTRYNKGQFKKATPKDVTVSRPNPELDPKLPSMAPEQAAKQMQTVFSPDNTMVSNTPAVPDAVSKPVPGAVPADTQQVASAEKPAPEVTSTSADTKVYPTNTRKKIDEQSPQNDARFNKADEILRKTNPDLFDYDKQVAEDKKISETAKNSGWTFVPEKVEEKAPSVQQAFTDWDRVKRNPDATPAEKAAALATYRTAEMAEYAANNAKLKQDDKTSTYATVNDDGTLGVLVDAVEDVDVLSGRRMLFERGAMDANGNPKPLMNPDKLVYVPKDAIPALTQYSAKVAEKQKDYVKDVTNFGQSLNYTDQTLSLLQKYDKTDASGNVISNDLAAASTNIDVLLSNARREGLGIVGSLERMLVDDKAVADVLFKEGSNPEDIQTKLNDMRKSIDSMVSVPTQDIAQDRVKLEALYRYQAYANLAALGQQGQAVNVKDFEEAYKAVAGAKDSLDYWSKAKMTLTPAYERIVTQQQILQQDRSTGAEIERRLGGKVKLVPDVRRMGDMVPPKYRPWLSQLDAAYKSNVAMPGKDDRATTPATPTTTTQVPPDETLPRPTSKDEYMKLAPGTWYIDPKGAKRQKPAQ